MRPFDEVCRALTAECSLVSGVVGELSEADFALPTRCPPWDVKVLMGHMHRDVDRILDYRDEPAPDEPDADSVSYFRSYDPVGDAPRISARSMEVSDAFDSGAALARSFEERWRLAVDAARAQDPGKVVRTFAPALRLEEYVKTRVLEIAVHGLDLADALGRPPWITPGGAAITRAILEGLLGVPPPPGLEWDDVAFIEAGTGRRPLTGAERVVLGEAATAFPLLA